MARRGWWSSAIALGALGAFVTACASDTSADPAASADGGSAEVADVVADADVYYPDVIEVSAGGKITVDGVPYDEIDSPVAGLNAFEPAPADTEVVFDGWSVVVTSAEVTTQPSEGTTTNPLTVVLQGELDVTAPQEINATGDDRMFPFRPAARIAGVDFVPCFAPDGGIVFSESERRTEEFCLAARGSEEWKELMPTATVELLYAGYQYVDRVEIALTRGPDY